MSAPKGPSTDARIARLEDAIRDLVLVATEGQPEIRLSRQVDERASSAGHRLLALLEAIENERVQ